MGGGGSVEVPRGEPSSNAAAVGREQTIGQLAVVEEFFRSMMRHAVSSESSAESSEPSLGGRLLYTAELDETGCALATAGNVAGAATLAATAVASTQKRAIRDGVVDFLVNSLDEALRILKNEIRKREPVAVCVSQEPEQIEREMLERGVQPDLLTEVSGALRGAELRKCETGIVSAEQVATEQAWLAWSVTEAPAQWMPKLDALALDCVSAEERETLRWLRHAQRYVSRIARGVRVLRCPPETAREIFARTEDAMKRGTIDAAVWMTLHIGEERMEQEWKSLKAQERGL